MNERSLKVLEYNKITDLLVSFAVSNMAKETLSCIKPLTDFSDITERLDETTEAVTITVRKGNIPLGELYDIEGSLLFAKKGGMLSAKQLLQVLYNLRVTQDVVGYLRGSCMDLKWLYSICDILVVLPQLSDKIDKIILSEDEISDSASPELRSIRREIKSTNDQIRTKLNSLVVSSDSKMYLQDAIVTMRDGRYVVPVKAEHRQKVSGIVHDQSSTGATLFIEPQAIVELNNRLRELEVDEQAEIERILLELSSNVAEHFKEIRNNQHLLVLLDEVFAKAKLSVSMEGARPEINEDGYLSLLKARHPLIDRKKVVPIDVEIGKNYTTLVITGPNTGGKTVTLKTIGLLSMMAQSGLHIPASERSSLPIFTDIFSDIGDEQSIEQSLSTFSSHMKNTVEFVEKASLDTLILLDELGAGTDPTEGAALGIAILEELKILEGIVELNRKGATIVATTHYNELKKYAISTPGVENASMQFDVETLSPTYRLLTGIPGKSNAFEISRKLGLKSDIIERAGTLIEKGELAFEDVLTKIEEDTKRAEASRIEAEAILEDIKRKEDLIRRREELLQKHEKETIDDAKNEARRLIKEAKDKVNSVQKELRNLNKVESLGERTKKITNIKSSLNEREKRYQTGLSKKENLNPVSVDDVKIGDKVKLLTIDQNAEVISMPDSNGNLQIKVGAMKLKANVGDLMYIGDTVKEKTDGKLNRAGKLRTVKAMAVSASRNVIGKNLDDALMEVEKYLDDAYIAGLPEVTIIHGRGEGILQQGIRKMLQTHHLVKSYHKGGYSEGGDGVTVVQLKKD
ncbi:MAG: endonuclease MutS2 [Clostridia bacterium]|nr:endonuclease MutS2 [Clostridia bacterium]